MECTNVGDSGCSNESQVSNNNDQVMECTNVGDSGCDNISIGFGQNGNIQNMECLSVGNSGCVNSAVGSDNTQNMNCKFVSVGCINDATGEGIIRIFSACIQHNAAMKINSDTEGNTQKSVCLNSGTCQNDGTGTKVISVKSSSCKNDDASGSTTICVNNRILTRTNS